MQTTSTSLAAIELLATGAAGDAFSWSSLEASGHVPLHGTTEQSFQRALDVLSTAGLLDPVDGDATGYDTQALEVPGPWYRINRAGLKVLQGWTSFLSGDAARDVQVDERAPHGLRILGLLQQDQMTEAEVCRALRLTDQSDALLERIGTWLAVLKDIGLVEHEEEGGAWRLTAPGAQHLLQVAIRQSAAPGRGTQGKDGP